MRRRLLVVGMVVGLLAIVGTPVRAAPEGDQDVVKGPRCTDIILGSFGVERVEEPSIGPLLPQATAAVKVSAALGVEKDERCDGATYNFVVQTDNPLGPSDPEPTVVTVNGTECPADPRITTCTEGGPIEFAVTVTDADRDEICVNGEQFDGLVHVRGYSTWKNSVSDQAPSDGGFVSFGPDCPPGNFAR